jgi:hypothetical protein
MGEIVAGHGEPSGSSVLPVATTRLGRNDHTRRRNRLRRAHSNEAHRIASALIEDDQLIVLELRAETL